MSESPQKTNSRPRPRPRPRNAISSTEHDKPGSSSKSVVHDEDAMFIRNRGRSANVWNKMNEAVDKREAARDQSSDLDSSDSDSPHTKKTKRQRFTSKVKEMPAWAKSDGLIQIKGSDSDSDSSTSVVILKSPKSKGASEDTPKAKRKRQRSRLRTESPEAQMQLAEQIGRERARLLLGNRPSREKSPTYISDEEVDDVKELPDELAAIKAEVKKRNPVSTSKIDNNSSATASVELKITLRPHPEDESGKSYVYSQIMKRNEKFEQLFADIADAGGIPSERLIVLFNNQRVYPWSMPQTHSIWAEAELVAYEEHVYKYIKNQERSPPPADNHDLAPASTDSAAFASVDSAAESDASQDKTDTFKLQVRLGEETVTVTVRQTTRCSAIVANVLRKMGKAMATGKKARIEVDGEKLNPDSEISKAELEDGDLIDIVGA